MGRLRRADRVQSQHQLGRRGAGDQLVDAELAALAGFLGMLDLFLAEIDPAKVETARKTIPSETRTMLLDLVNPIKSDLQSLRKDL